MNTIIKAAAGLIVCMAAAHAAEHSATPTMKRAKKVEPILVDTTVIQSSENCAVALRYKAPPPQIGMDAGDFSTILIRQPCSKLVLAGIVVDRGDRLTASPEAKSMRFEEAEMLAKRLYD